MNAKEAIGAGRRWTIESGTCAPEAWGCESFYRTKPEARAAAVELAIEMGDPCGYVGRCRIPGIDDFSPRFRAESLIEQMGEQMFELVGEAADGWPVDEQDLVKELTPLMAQAVAIVLRRGRSLIQIDRIDTVEVP